MNMILQNIKRDIVFIHFVQRGTFTNKKLTLNTTNMIKRFIKYSILLLLINLIGCQTDKKQNNELKCYVIRFGESVDTAYMYFINKDSSYIEGYRYYDKGLLDYRFFYLKDKLCIKEHFYHGKVQYKAEALLYFDSNIPIVLEDGPAIFYDERGKVVGYKIYRNGHSINDGIND